MPLPSEQHENTTSEYTPCKTDTRRGMIKHMLGCLGKAPPDRSLFNMSDYIIQQIMPYMNLLAALLSGSMLKKEKAVQTKMTFKLTQEIRSPQNGIRR